MIDLLYGKDCFDEFMKKFQWPYIFAFALRDVIKISFILVSCRFFFSEVKLYFLYAKRIWRLRSRVAFSILEIFGTPKFA